MTMKPESAGILDLLTCPGFCVKDNIITQVNQAAAAMLLVPGTDVRTLLMTGLEEYAEFRSGILYLKLNLSEEGLGASVTRQEDGDYFLLEHSVQNEALQALALAARELRTALSGTIVSADQLGSQLDPENAKIQEQLSRINLSLHKTLRVIGNMSDAGGWPYHNRKEIREIGGLISEIFEKAAALTEESGARIEYQGMKEDIYCLVDHEQLERAIYNILSNALKFTSKDTRIQAKLVRRNRMLQLTIQDNGSGMPDNVRSTLFSRYLRQSSLEDSRYGLGLGMVIVQSAAAAHGGTVLVDHPEGSGTRVTLTLRIQQDSDNRFRSPIRHPDYAGERDHALLELSDCLPHTLY